MRKDRLVIMKKNGIGLICLLLKNITQQAKLQLKNEMITGFKGSETAGKINVVEKFILGINRKCF